MEKLKMLTPNLVKDNIEKIKQIFPNCVVEHINGGKPELAVDFDRLTQELSSNIVKVMRNVTSLLGLERSSQFSLLTHQ